MIKAQEELFKKSNLELKDLFDYISTHTDEYYISYGQLWLDKFMPDYKENKIYYCGKIPFIYGGIMNFESFDLNKLHIKFPVDHFEHVLNNIKVLKNEI